MKDFRELLESDENSSPFIRMIQSLCDYIDEKSKGYWMYG